MPSIKIDLIAPAANVPPADLPLNVVLVQELPGSQRTLIPRPMRVSGMAEVAKLAQPQSTVRLKDEKGREVECHLRYGDDIRSNDDLKVRLGSEWIHKNLESSDGRLNPLLRLKAREELLRKLKVGMRSTQLSKQELLSSLLELRKQLEAHVAETTNAGYEAKEQR